MESCDELEVIINDISTKTEFQEMVDKLQILSYNERANKKVLSLVEKSIAQGLFLEDKKSLIKLYSFKITHIQHLKENLPIVINLVKKIELLSEEIGDIDGLALYYAHRWYIEKFKGNKKKAKIAIEKSMNYINQSGYHDKFIKFICKYIYATESWLENHDPNSAFVLEECLDYFYNNGYNRSLTQILGILGIIYQRTQNWKKATEVSKKLFINRYYFDQQSKDVQAMSYYFAAVGQLLVHNLKQAENLLEVSYQLFNVILENSSYYSYYYVRLLSHRAIVQSLQGKLDESLEQIKKIEDLLKEESILRNMDEYSKKQVPHTLNLIRFYVYSRLYGFNHKSSQDHIKKIFESTKENYSDSIMLSEFLLNAELNYAQLKELQETENASLRRVGNIINYMIEKTKIEETTSEEKFDKFLIALNNKPSIKDLTFTEKAFTDLLVAQQLYLSKRYAEIYTLLKKYECKINRIEVLELRIFMEGFIQVGAYKCGDPLGSALQYMAIKKCRMYGFSRLENTLLNYLDMQKKEVLPR
ncbi:MAG: hypothetical protein ACTSVO_00580 [Candidatus Heimdallarchaeaceae archaeon]